MMLEIARETLTNACQIEPGARLIVGISGGPDSLCLLHLLQQLDVQVIAAHLNHQLRPEAGRDAIQVAETAAKLAVEFVLEETDVRGYAEANGKSLEEAAREKRYDFLYRIAREQNAHAVAVGHTADDQVETVLMHLLRGSGLAGLTGMQPRSINAGWSREIALIRPLLSIWRAEVEAYCQENQLDPLFDQSNLDTTFYRNRLRRELIPYLEGYNPQVKRLLWQMADTLAGDEAAIDAVVAAHWPECLADQGAGWVVLRRKVLMGLQVGLQRRVWRKAIAQLRPGLRDIDYAAIRRAVAFGQSPSQTNQIDLVAGLRLLIEDDMLWLAAWEADLPTVGWPQVEAGQTYQLPIPGEIELDDGWMLQADWETAPMTADTLADHQDPYQVWVDAGNLATPLLVRGRVAGDRFAPLGMDGHTLKLADFFINEKLPQRARAGWPLVCSGSEIVWVPGFRLSHCFRLQGGTEEVVRLCLIKAEAH
ncbi:MAG: tRNA lysidine(34) synthetase TilS [Anaerolineales bacterium]|nr:tRNA lysidine(34) synthetase TilS [Anaerolineales bacterium]